MLIAQDKKSFMIGAGLFLLVVCQWLAGFFYAPVDAMQGEVYRIIFLHVPSAFTAFGSSLVLFILSLIGLRTKSEATNRWARATAEVGLMYTILTLATGSIWGRPTWGVWWTWDARLTTTLLLALLYAGYLLLHSAMAPGPGRVKVCAVLGILIFADVPIIYKSVTWWRTLHQPPSMLRADGPTMDPQILWTMVAGIFIMCFYAFWLGRQRGINLALADELEQASYAQLKG